MIKIQEINNNFDWIEFFKYEGNFKITNHGNYININPCPICGHGDHFFISKNNNSMVSYNCNLQGTKPINYFMQKNNLDYIEAIKILYEYLGIEYIKPNKDIILKMKVKAEKTKKMNEHMDKIIKEKYSFLANKYKNLRKILNSNYIYFKKNGMNHIKKEVIQVNFKMICEFYKIDYILNQFIKINSFNKKEQYEFLKKII